MTTSERERHRLHQTLDEVIGPDVAAILMSHLPPVGWADVATKHDLVELEGRFTNQLRAAISDLRSELHTEIGGLRSELHAEIGGLRSEMHAQIGGLRSAMHAESGSLHAEIGSLHAEIGSLRTDMHQSLQSMARTYLLGNIALVLTVVAVAFGAARLV